MLRKTSAPGAGLYFRRYTPPPPLTEVIIQLLLFVILLIGTGYMCVQNKQTFLPMVAVLPGHGNSSRPYFQKTTATSEHFPAKIFMNTACFLILHDHSELHVFGWIFELMFSSFFTHHFLANYIMVDWLRLWGKKERGLQMMSSCWWIPGFNNVWIAALQ